MHIHVLSYIYIYIYIHTCIHVHTCVYLLFIYACIYIYIYICTYIFERPAPLAALLAGADGTVAGEGVQAEALLYTQSPLQDSRLFGHRPWKVLATTYEQMGS